MPKRIGEIISDSQKFFLDLLFPIKCLSCGREKEFVCQKCLESVAVSKETPFEAISQASSLDGLLIAGYYENPLLRKMIHSFKYDFIKDLAGPISFLMVKRIEEYPFLIAEKESVFLVPVPLHKKRLRWRGFNQAALLAQEISLKTNIKTADNILLRHKYDVPQAKTGNSQQRKENIKNSFSLMKRQPNFSFADKTFILVDDVAATCGTLEECALPLKELRPRKIIGLVAAKG